MWLQWYAEQVNDEVKDEFLNQIELENLVKRVSPKVQLEILEFAPVEVKRLVESSIHKQYKEKIMWNVEDEIEKECSLDELKQMARKYKEETDRILNYDGRQADD
jgi:hypothetical protein